MRDPILVEMPEGLEELVPDYLSSRREEVPDLLRMLSLSDYDRIRVAAHNLKGTGSAYGFPPVTEIGAAMEGSAKEANADSLSGQIKSLAEYLERVRLCPAPASKQP